MPKGLLLTVAGIALFALIALAVGTHSAIGLITVTAYEADVNKNGSVNAQDLGFVAQRFGQLVPMPTPALLVTYHVFQTRAETGTCTEDAPCVPSIAWCDHGDSVMGGGWREGSNGSAGSFFISEPTVDPDGRQGWLVVRRSASSYHAVATCLDRAPLHGP
jgi:hypothetical protein